MEMVKVTIPAADSAQARVAQAVMERMELRPALRELITQYQLADPEERKLLAEKVLLAAARGLWAAAGWAIDDTNAGAWQELLETLLEVQACLCLAAEALSDTVGSPVELLEATERRLNGGGDGKAGG